MTNISDTLKFILNLAKVQTIMSRKLDAKLYVHSLGFNDFVILYHLSAHGEKLRRIDLAEKIGLTASAVTRMLAPMEKTGLVARERNERDARVSYVILTAAGKRLLNESVKTAERIAADILPASKNKNLEKMTELLKEMGGDI